MTKRVVFIPMDSNLTAASSERGELVTYETAVIVGPTQSAKTEAEPQSNTRTVATTLTHGSLHLRYTPRKVVPGRLSTS